MKPIKALALWWNRRTCRIKGHVLIQNSDKYRVLVGAPREWCSRCDYVERR